MSEFLKAPHNAIEESDIRSSYGELAEKEPLSTGEEAPKQFVELSIKKDGQERKAGRFLKREYTNPEHTLADALKADELRSAGIPVPPTVRYSEDDEGKPYLLITDLTENEHNTVWSMNNSDEKLPYLNTEQQNHFFHLLLHEKHQLWPVTDIIIQEDTEIAH